MMTALRKSDEIRFSVVAKYSKVYRETSMIVRRMIIMSVDNFGC